ncbi:Crp/Fnr family transcriptional regulator [Variovorax saccharolyticus]|uniref:Crp/Fnr family transcriptional regulator n=1 Tax=Variovorax saccharolyticus TaxID=3053516 RepID=UPI002576A2DE|nr:Crp/Fnr family transcriptional regulator [Variovorax sp. J22R187]MDM0022851.1 Crp/Fnr family transcriptional regulator [Variovorax sp. J22R187]
MPAFENHLIELLPQGDRRKLLARCDAVQLVLSDVLCLPGEPTPYVYFPVDGFISLVTTIDGSPGLEVGMVGREGMVGAHVALGVETAPLRAVVQGSGSAWRVAADVFKEQITGSTALKRVLDRYVFVLMAQLTTSAACLRYHEIGPRLARWLLMSQDRAHSDRFRMTHEFLAYMLGVRRVGITAAAGVLQHNGLIEYARGDLKVLDRTGLEAAACGCYAVDRKSYADLLG